MNDVAHVELAQTKLARLELGEGELDALWASAPTEALQRTTDIARRVLKAPVSLVSSFTADRQIVRSTSGFEHLAGSLPLSGNVCRRVYDSGRPLTVADLALDETDATMPREVAAYIGAPMRLASGQEIGTLCVMDLAPHSWTRDDLDLLVELAAFLTNQIELKLEIVLREKAEEALGATKARLLAVADRIPGLVFERRKVDADRSTYTFFGSNKTTLPAVRQMMEAGGSGALSFLHRDDRDVFRAAILRSTLEEIDLDLTFRVKEVDGTVRWMRSQSLVRRDHDGVYWDGLCFDVTDLVAARENAEAARASKDAVVVNVNHELRTPLQAIIGFTDFMKTETRPDLVQAHARNIQAAAESLLAIVNQSLTDAESGAPSPSVEPFELRSFGETCLSMVGPASVAKQLTTRIEIDADVPATVVLERQALKQAVLNLLNNAVKFTDTGGYVLRITRAAKGLRFGVSDTGIGIPEDRRDLLFQRFSRVGPMDRPSEGSGLGLSITKDLVEGMGGRIGVEGHAGRGTTFWFEVPLASPPTNPDAAAVSVEHAAELPQPAAARPSPTGARILLADDLDLNRKLIADMLGTDGHLVDCVTDGAAAVKAASERRYDVILMDMIMPGMDGIAATRAIRKLPAPACDVPILALTANSFKEQLDSCLTAGMNATLTKPMSLDALTSAVSNWTRGRNKAA